MINELYVWGGELEPLAFEDPNHSEVDMRVDNPEKYGFIKMGDGWASHEWHGHSAAKYYKALSEAIMVLGWDELLEELSKAVRGKTADDKAYAAYEAVKAISKDDPDLSLSPYSGPVPPKTVPSLPVAIAPKTGFSCIGCGNFNPDAAANQSDGTYLCYNCRC